MQTMASNPWPAPRRPECKRGMDLLGTPNVCFVDGSGLALWDEIPGETFAAKKNVFSPAHTCPAHAARVMLFHLHPHLRETFKSLRAFSLQQNNNLGSARFFCNLSRLCRSLLELFTNFSSKDYFVLEAL